MPKCASHISKTADTEHRTGRRSCILPSPASACLQENFGIPVPPLKVVGTAASAVAENGVQAAPAAKFAETQTPAISAEHLP
jgi:hypothetical protein